MSMWMRKSRKRMGQVELKSKLEDAQCHKLKIQCHLYIIIILCKYL
jgi:hypothetical protein